MRPLPLLRSIVFSTLIFPLMTLFLSSLGLIYFIFTRKQELLTWCGWTWGRWALWLLNIELTTKDLDKVPPSGCLLLFNHTSFVDIFAMAALLPGIRFGAKIELFSIPVFGKALKYAGILPIARGDRARAIRVLERAEQRARNGEKFALAPEGTRNSEEKLLPFKSGPFIFAIHAGVPLVPVIIKGACDAWPKSAFLPCADNWRHQVSIQILDPVSVSEYTVETKAPLVEKVHNLMANHF